MRARGVKVGFIGITASKMPELFADHCDFILNGEPEAAVMRLAQGEIPQGIVVSEQIDDLDSLPFPRWDLVTEDRATARASSGRRVRSAAAIRCSRAAAARSSAPTARTGSSPATARGRSRTSSTRSSGCAISIARPYVIFRDPLFTRAARPRASSCATRSARAA